MTGWGKRLSIAAFVLAAGAMVLGLGGAIGAGQDYWDKLLGLSMLQYGFFIAAVALVLAVAALIVHARKRTGSTLVIGAALMLSVVYVGYVVMQIRIAQSVPFIHDVTTDLANPPMFQTLTLRADNLETVPEGGPELKALPAVERWRRLHAAGYAYLKPVVVARPVAETVALIEQLARARGWTIAAVDPAGRVEATDSVSLFAFKDDIVFRVVPAPGGSRVDMRSVSRLGASDLGVNAGRIREFMIALKESAG